MRFWTLAFFCITVLNALGQEIKYTTLSSGEQVVLYGDKTWDYRSDFNYTKVKPLLLHRPSFTGNTLDSGQNVASVTLKQVFSEVSEGYKPDAWLKRNGLDLNRTVYHPSASNYDQLPSDMSKTYQSSIITQHFVDSSYHFIAYEGERNSGRYLVIMNKDMDSVIAALDFYYYQKAPVSRKYGYDGFDFTSQGLAWVKCINDTLYFSTHHRTYADSSERKNAYITCFDLKSKEVIWRSDPLISNARTFALHGDHIFTGYGFTNEDDFIYGLNRFTGKVLLKHPLKKGPSMVIEKNNQLYVRTYNRNYVFDIIKED